MGGYNYRRKPVRWRSGDDMRARVISNDGQTVLYDVRFTERGDSVVLRNRSRSADGFAQCFDEPMGGYSG